MTTLSLSLASYAHESVWPPSLSLLGCLRVGEVVSGRRWLSRATSRTHNYAVQCPPIISIFKNSFEDNVVSGQQHVLDMLTLESDVFQLCLSAQPAPAALQRFNRCKGALLLRDLAARAPLPHSALFSQQLLDLTGGGRKLQAPTSKSTISTPLRLRLTLALNCTPQGTLSWPHFSFQTPGSQPAPSPTFSQLLLLFSTGVSLTTFRLCTQPGQSTKLLPKNIASWSQRTTSWGPTHQETG